MHKVRATSFIFKPEELVSSKKNSRNISVGLLGIKKQRIAYAILLQYSVLLHIFVLTNNSGNENLHDFADQAARPIYY